MKKSLILGAIVLFFLGTFYFVRQNSLSGGMNPKSDKQKANTGVSRAEYKNIKHKYLLSYPVSAEMGDGVDIKNTDLQNADNIFIAMLGKEAELFSVSVVDPKQTKQYPFDLSVETYNLDLKNFSDVFRKKTLVKGGSNAQKTATSLEETLVDGMKGYRFILTTTFGGNDVFTGPYSFTHLFLERAGKKYILHFPSDNEESQKILASLKFN